MAGKEGIFIILDISKSMGLPYNDTMTRLDFAKESIQHLLRQKVIRVIMRLLVAFYRHKRSSGNYIEGSEQSR